MRKIFWSPEAVADLRNIYHFYLPDNPRFATFLHWEIKKEARRLIKFPSVAPVETLLEKCDKTYRSLVIYSMFKLIYYTKKNQIVIVSIWDCRRNPKTLKQSVE